MSKNSDKEAQSIWETLKNNFKDLITNNTNDCVRRRPAIVIDADNVLRYATVRFPLAPNRDDQNMYLMNCSGKPLKTGDNVWIEFMYGLNNAFIAIKNDGRPWGWK